MKFKTKLTAILPGLAVHPTTLIVGAMVASNGSTYGQGTVLFDTKAMETGAYVYDATEFGGELLGAAYAGDGTNFLAQLYAAAGTGAPISTLVAVGQPVNFRGGVNAGWVQTSGTTSLGFALTPAPPGPGSVVTIPFLTPGGPATIQMRVWWGGGTEITTFEDALVSSNPNLRWGFSAPINLTQTGSAGGIPSPDLVGLMGFQLHKMPGAPPLTLRPMGPNTLTICWPYYPSTGYGLQLSTNLNTVNWVAVTNVPVQVNDEWQITVTVPTQGSLDEAYCRYYRLKKP